MEDFTKILDQIQASQKKVQEIQQKLTQIQATAEAGAGAVTATVDGHRRVLKLDIDQEFIHPEEKEVLQDLIIAAITLANQAVAEKVKEEVQKSASGMLGEIPIDFML
jgi:nucleoid-associated protein EbfC